MSEEDTSANLAGKKPTDWAEYWGKEIAAAKKWTRKWHTSGRRIENHYLAQDQSATDEVEGEARFNIFWSNVQVLLGALYAKLPRPEVDRTHLDASDDAARVAGIILERIFDFELQNLNESPKDSYKLAIQDFLIPGMGITWPRYEFTEQQQTFPPIIDPVTGIEQAPAVNYTVITDEMVPIEYIRWDDFLYSPTKTWEKVRWVSKCVDMDKEALEKRFGAAIAAQVPLKNRDNKNSHPDDPRRVATEPMADVWEIWDKRTKMVFWWAQGSPVILDAKQDPLRLQGFFPPQKPLIASHVSAAFLPRPDYAMVQDQYNELHLLASRMRLLTEALKVVGVYDKNNEAVQRLLNQAGMNQLIPVDNWAMFAEKGGIKGTVDWFPLEMVINTLEKCTSRKLSLVQEIYEILGLSDIMRGMSVATETATAQQLKAQYGSARMTTRQEDVAEFITAGTRTRAEIISKHWQPETIKRRSQIMSTPDAQWADAAIQLIKDTPELVLRLNVTVDTISAPDWNREKQERIDFLQAISQFIGMSMQLVQSSPGAAVYLVQIIQWAATGFKAGKHIEGVLDQALQALQKQVANPKPKEPTPKDKKDLASADKTRADAAGKNLETMMTLDALGLPPGSVYQVPPGVQQPPGQGGPGRPPETALPPPRTLQ